MTPRVPLSHHSTQPVPKQQAYQPPVPVASRHRKYTLCGADVLHSSQLFHGIGQTLAIGYGANTYPYVLGQAERCTVPDEKTSPH